jgi:hypothetical protein
MWITKRRDIDYQSPRVTDHDVKHYIVNEGEHSYFKVVAEIGLAVSFKKSLVLPPVDVINGLHVDPYQTALVISTAKSIYCPQYLGVRV